MIRNLRKGAQFFAAIAACLFVLSGQAHAATSDGPNQSDFYASTRYGDSNPGVDRTVDYVVGTSAYSSILSTKIKIYLPSSTGTVVIHNQNICYNTFQNGGRNYDQLDDGVISSSGNAVSFTLDGVTKWGAFDGTSTCDSKTLSFSVNGATLDPNTNMYFYTLSVVANSAPDKYLDTFWVTAPTGSYVSQDSSLASSSFGLSETSPIPSGSNPPTDQTPPDPYRNYWSGYIKFAPDCTVTTPTVTKRIEIYDDDNHNNWDVQPRPFYVRLHEYDRAGNFISYITPTITLPDGGGTWSSVGSGYYDVYGGGNGKRIYLDYKMNRDYVYRWELSAVYYDNTIQFKIPFDNIYYYQACQQPASTLKAGMTVSPPTIGQDETATFTPTITPSSYRANQTVNCTISRTFYPAGGGVPSDLGAQPCTDSGGNSNITVGSTIVNLKPNTYSSPSTALPGSKICDTITITSPTDPGYFANAADKSATGCVIIAKTPYVHVLGGDTYVGGNFAAINAACNNSAKVTTTGRLLSDGSTAGSGGEYNVFASGNISGFGSSGSAIVGTGSLGAANRQLTFANSEPDATKLGYFGETQHCITDYIPLFSGAALMAGGSTVNVGTRGANGSWHVTGDLNISGTMPAGTAAGGQQVYYVDGDVNITGDIKYPATYASVADIPSLLIVTKGNVNVTSSTAQIDGVFEVRGDGTTTGIFKTCTPKTEPAAVGGACDLVPLTVNGAVSASNFDLFRTAGASGATPNDRKQPAETFSLTPEIYLNNALNSVSSSTIKTTTILDLPPRF